MSVAIAVICILAVLLYIVIKSPFSYPYFIYNFDVSGKRIPQIDDLLNMFLIHGGFECIQNHQKKIEQWKKRVVGKLSIALRKNIGDNNIYVLWMIVGFSCFILYVHKLDIGREIM